MLDKIKQAGTEVPAAVRSLIDTHTQPFVLIDRNFTIVAVNQAYATQYKQKPQELLGKKCHKVSHRSDEPCFYHGEDCPHARLFHSRREEQAVHIHYDTDGEPEYVNINAYPIFGDDGELAFMGEMLKRIDARAEAGHSNLVGTSSAFLHALAEASELTAGEAPVLISGETGVGKVAFATFLHAHSERAHAPLVTVICSDRSETELEAELFGHQPGAFTGAEQGQAGALEQADKGSLFLREIGSLPKNLQAKLANWLATGQYRRVGGLRVERSNARLLTSSSSDLEDMVQHGEFRGDLYYKLSGATLSLPPLRERVEDIPVLTCHFLRQRPRPLIPTAGVLECLRNYPFPGNVGELVELLEQAASQAGDGNSVELSHLPGAVREPPRATGAAGGNGQGHRLESGLDPATFRPRRKEDRTILGVDTETVIRTLAEHGGSRRQAASVLGISERKLYRLLDRYKVIGLPIPEPYQ